MKRRKAKWLNLKELIKSMDRHKIDYFTDSDGNICMTEETRKEITRLYPQLKDKTDD